MACPSGCLAGGGQLKPSPDQTPQQMLEQLELAYHHQVRSGTSLLCARFSQLHESRRDHFQKQVRVHERRAYHALAGWQRTGSNDVPPPSESERRNYICSKNTPYKCPLKDIIPRHPADNPAVQQLYCSTMPGGPGSCAARTLLHTSYRKRESTVASAATVSDW
eukprot:1159399-Pelagomonas_calceolata.AAC.2